MCSDLLIDKICYWKCFWNDDSAVFWKFCKIYRKISMTEFTFKDITECRVATPLSGALCQI